MKSILVVGGSSSLGVPVLDRLQELPARILATYHRHPAIPKSKNIQTVPLDLTNEAGLDLFGDIVSKFGPLDMAVFLSGLLPGKSLGDYGDSKIDEVMEINFTGQAKLIRRLIPFFKDGSNILMLSSISAQRGSFDPIYAAAKGAVLSFVKSMAATLAPKIRINALAPSLIEDSKMFQDMTPERREWHRSQNPMKKLLKREDLAAVIHDLAQDHWSHLNGACIDLNGGHYVR